MKKLLLLLLLLFITPTTSNAIVIGWGNSSCGCTGALIFAAHFENNDNISIGSPCGCSTNADVTFDKVNTPQYSTTQKDDGSYSAYFDAASDELEIPTNINKTEGTVIFRVYVSSRTAGVTERFIRVSVDSSNEIVIGTATIENSAYFSYIGGGTVLDCALLETLNTGFWYTVTAKWRATGIPHLSLTVDASTDTDSGTLPTLTGTLGSMELGRGSSSTTVFYIDNLRVYNTWQ